MDSIFNQMFLQFDPLGKLAANNINNFKKLILTRPKKYENFILSDINQIRDREDVNLCGTITNQPVLLMCKSQKKIIRFKILLSNENVLEIIVFNNFFLKKLLTIKKNVFVKGKYYLHRRCVVASFISSELNICNTIKPIYEFKSFSDEKVKIFIQKLFSHPKFHIKENLNQTILQRYNLLSKTEAFKNLHLPQNQQMLKRAFLRFKFEEAFFILKKMFQLKEKLPVKTPLEYDIDYVRQIIKTIPFELTLDQKKIVNCIYSDFKKNYSTERIIQGDVSSGKTIIVFLAALGVISAGKQVLLMAPTEILAKQHYLNFKKFSPSIKTVFLTSKSISKKLLQENIKNGFFKMVIGTHVLSSIDFDQLGLIIFDETHKFGVDIKEKAISQNSSSDILHVTATPIPKTLSTMYFGFLPTSLLKNLPYKKRNIVTIKCSFDFIVPLLIKNQVKNEQTYIVVPAIDDKSKFFNIQNITFLLKSKKIDHFYVLHGKKTLKEKESVMYDFINNQKGILLSTSIIEVGIDVYNATTMIILGAEYFGLSQLHQLRGRIGRNNKQNYCFLVYHKHNSRLDILKREDNGFYLSKFDLKHRGPGDFLGKKQSGYFMYKFLNVKEDYKIIKQVHKYLCEFS
ncbi:DEAD/DEAH box helicase [Candidatus Phytoplasma melaleucae]|uniref:Helicase-related protein n=1 Tax=Candidatus Phytoplasma melaleucae TaxID=2982630 RepID=A0ABT9DFH4_9MOLU|nr:DEAD/DEAH box helicase ['Melaleuca sp.' phytoplasma]MDO8168055.1 helicase-related protein ['Melaleuca sp.' phytoplasma]